MADRTALLLSLSLSLDTRSQTDKHTLTLVELFSLSLSLFPHAHTTQTHDMVRTTPPPIAILFSLVLMLALIATAQQINGDDGNQEEDQEEEAGAGAAEITGEAVPFQDAFSVIWGDVLIDHPSPHSVQLKLDRNSGSGFVSLETYMYAHISASIKLPKDNTAGIVLAFYTSNGDDFPSTHDELDFEFLGNVKGKPWRLQTNIYGNGSTARGREERFNFWFDPTTDFHTYSILWNHNHTVFFVDDIPIREMKKTEELGGDYPSKPMALYATMWDGSSWATSGGKFPVNYKYAPFFTTFKNFEMNGCAANPILEEQTEISSSYTRNKMNLCHDNPAEARDLWELTASQKRSLEWVRTHHMYYTYCQDSARNYSTSLPECTVQAKYRLNKPSGSRGHHNKQRARKTNPSATPS